MGDLKLVNIVVEDDLSEAVVRKLVCPPCGRFSVGVCYGKQGYGYIQKRISGFNYASRGVPYIVLTDLDRWECPARLRESWLKGPAGPNLLFRVAVHEVEAWLLADAPGAAHFLGVPRTLVPAQPDLLPDPKMELVNLARRSKFRRVREAIVPRRGSTAAVGPDYNGQLVTFVQTAWNVDRASCNSDSLRRFRERASAFQLTVR